MMHTIIGYILFMLALFVLTYAAYVGVSILARKYHGKEAPLWAKGVVWAFIILLDAPTNILVMTPISMFLGLGSPKTWKWTWTVTARMKHWKRSNNPKKVRFANWLCEGHLDYHDPTGDHC